MAVITCAPNVPNGEVYSGYRNRWRQEEVADGIRVIRVWSYLAPNKGTLRRTANYVSFMITAAWQALWLPRPGVLIATSPQFFCGWAGALAALIRRLPFVLEIRDIWPESITAVGAINNKALICLLEFLEKHLYRRARLIVTVGEGYRQRLVQKGVAASKIAVIMNGWDNDVFQSGPEDTKLRQQWHLDGKFVCSYSGTIGMACGLDTVLQAASELEREGERDIVFLLVGDGAVREDLQRKAADMGLDNVIFAGRQPKELMPAYLTLSDVCLVHLRKTELFTTVMPSKIFEAAGMKRPIINGVSGFAAEFVKESGSGINIEPESSQQLVQAVRKLKADPALCRALGQSGFEYVSTHFDRDRLAKDYLEHIENVANGR